MHKITVEINDTEIQYESTDEEFMFWDYLIRRFHSRCFTNFPTLKMILLCMKITFTLLKYPEKIK